MGYSTSFDGSFELSEKLAVSQLETLRSFRDYDNLPEGAPDAECPWEVTDDELHLEVLGEEKMKEWAEWLTYICEHVLVPGGATLSGSVVWQGEDIGDCGVIFVKDNQVRFVGIHEMPEPNWDCVPEN